MNSTELVLHEAAAVGDYQELQSMVMIGRFDVNHKDEDFGNRTALHWATSKAFISYDHGLSFEMEGNNSGVIESENNSSSSSSSSSSSGTNLGNNFNNQNDLLLHEVCARGDTLKLEELGSSIRRGKIEVNAADEDWGDRTALHWAAYKGHAKCVKLLLEYGADPTARMLGGWTPAHCAAETGRLNVLKVLLDNEAPVSLPDDTGDTPRRVAEVYGHWACVEMLQSAEDCQAQKGMRLKDKFRSQTRKISRMLGEQRASGNTNDKDKSKSTN